MRIAYLSNYSPDNIQVWSGTPYHVFHHLQKYHDVEWIGGGIINGTKWYHRIRGRKDTFRPEYYCNEEGHLLTQQINEGNFNVVITCTYHFCVSLKVNIPVVFYSDVTFELYKDFFSNKDSFYHKLVRETEQRCLECVDAIVYPSEWARNDALVNYQIPKNKVHVIEFGANIPFPHHIDPTLKKKEVCHLVFVGRNWERKGGKKMIEIYQILKSQNFPCQLTMIGCTPPKDFINDDIKYYPWLNKESPVDMECYDHILREAHFMILPTDFDAYGIVFCEASAYGVPSIATNIGGVSQPIRDGINGYLLSPTATANDYAHKIHDIFEDEELYFQLRKNARKEYENRLNWDTWCSRVTLLLEKLVKQKQADSNKEFYFPVYAINLPSRKERRIHLEAQFTGKGEFEVTYIDAVQHEFGAVGLWESMKKAVNLAMARNEDIIIICEDDHTFTPYYKKEYFIHNVIEAFQQGAEIISGGIGGFGHAVPVGNNRYWVDWFYCTQFIIISRRIYRKILDYDFKPSDTADGVLSKLTEEKQTLFPFISVQKDFGYSDVTLSNNAVRGRIEYFFRKSESRLSMVHQVFHHHIS